MFNRGNPQSFATMTLKQIEKQIETANKNIAKFGKGVEMYRARAINAIAKANKRHGIEMTLDDITITDGRGSLGFYTVETSIDKPYDEILDFTESCRIRTALEFMTENAHKASKERTRVQELTKTRDALAKAIADEEASTAPIESALRNVMSDFRTEWFNRMIEWHGSHYDYMKSIEPEIRKRRRIASEDKDATWRIAPVMKSPEYMDAERRYTECGRILSDMVFLVSSKEEYMAKVRKELANTWENGIKILADKARKFGIDESSITASAPTVTEKGFETFLQDGKARTIHARVIWAAEHSEIVTPHTRYIVTEIKD